jgi:hypothetical protein
VRHIVSICCSPPERTPREHAEHILHRPAAADLARLFAKHQILPHRQRGEDVARFRDVAETPARGLMRLQPGDLFALEQDRAFRRHVAHQRLDRRRTADAVAPEQADDLACADAKRDAVQNMALAVIGVEIVDFEQAHAHQCAACPR